MTIQEMTRRLDDEKREIDDLLHRQMDQAVAEGRDRTDSEKRDVDERIARAKVLKQRLDKARGEQSLTTQLDNITGGRVTRSRVDGNVGGDRRSGADADAAVRGTLGAQFVASDTYREYLRYRETGQIRNDVAWVTPSSELMATTLDESTGSAGKLVVSDYQIDITPMPTRRLTVEDLLSPGNTGSNAVTYMKETTFTNAAAPTAEGAAKPESTLVFDQVTDNVRKIATWLPATEEILEDVPQIRSYIDARLRLAVNLSTDDQLLNGNGTPPNIQGILNRVGLAAAQARGTDTNADAILKQIAAIETAQSIEVDGIVMNPTNWLSILLLKNANGDYIAGSGPLTYVQRPVLWGRPVALTTAIAAGTALVGAFKTGAQWFSRSPIRVDISNSHNDYFVKNLLAIRAERRGALTVYRPGAFGSVTGLV